MMENIRILQTFAGAMTGFIMILGVSIPGSVLAQDGGLGKCSAEQVFKLLDTGFGRPEIAKICNAKLDAGQGNSSPSSAPAPAIRNINSLDGVWSLQTDCDSYSGYSDHIELKGGTMLGYLNFGEDTHTLRGYVDKNGKVEMYSTGNWPVMGVFEGEILDWGKGTAKGTIEGGGELICEGFFTMQRNR